MSAPDDHSMKKCLKVCLFIVLMYEQDLKQHNVKILLRCCEKTYQEEELSKNNIQVEVSNN